MSRKLAPFTLALALFLLAACGREAPEATATPEPATASSPVAAATPEAAPTAHPEPSPTPSPTPTPFPPTTNVILPMRGAETSPRTVEEIAAIGLEGVGLRTVVIRELSSVADLRIEYVTSEELRERVSQAFESRRSAIEAEQLLYEILGIIPSGQDIYANLLALHTEGTLIHYDEDENAIYVAQDMDGITRAHERMYVHEFTHHLQALNFDVLAKADDLERNSDELRALKALLEGDATIAEILYINEFMEEAEVAESAPLPSAEFMAAIDSAPYVAHRLFVFPYKEGFDFTVELLLSTDSWENINEALMSPPVSTEQVIHADKYFEREAPTRVAIPELGWALGRGWERVGANTLGELGVLAWLETGFPTGAASVAAAGWGGDAYSLFRGPGGQSVLVLLMVWDTVDDAREFYDAARRHAEVVTGATWRPAPIGPEGAIADLSDRVVYIERKEALTLHIYAPDAELVATLREAYVQGQALD